MRKFSAKNGVLASAARALTLVAPVGLLAGCSGPSDLQTVVAASSPGSCVGAGMVWQGRYAQYRTGTGRLSDTEAKQDCFSFGPMRQARLSAVFREQFGQAHPDGMSDAEVRSYLSRNGFTCGDPDTEGTRLCVAEHRVRTSDGFSNLMVLTVLDFAYYALFIDPDYNFRRLRFTVRLRPMGPGRQEFTDFTAVPLGGPTNQ